MSFWRAVSARLASATQPVRTPPRPIANYVGQFEDAALGRMEIMPDSAGLRLRWGVLDVPLEVQDAAKNVFVARDFGGLSELQFVFGDDGRGVAIETEGRRLARL